MWTGSDHPVEKKKENVALGNTFSPQPQMNVLVFRPLASILSFG